MTIKLILAILSSVMAVIVFIPYFVDIFKKTTQPHIYTWLIWSILQSIGVAALFKGGAGYGAWSLATGAIFCFAIFLLSFKFGTRNIKKIDVYCLIAAIIAIGVYLFVENPLYSIILVTLIDFIGFIPTFRKGYEEPYSETLLTFLLNAVANLFSIAALEYYSATTMLYLISLFITNSTLCIILITRRKIIPKIV